MGFVKPYLPDLDYDEWRSRPRAERIRTMVVHWGSAGFGTPDGVYLLYLVKIVAYVAGAVFFVTLTPGIGGFGEVTSWWTQPVVFEKVVLWTLLFEVIGLGCGFGPLTLRFLPPLGAFLHWLRPGTVRLPPWPGKVPGTRGTTRTWLDVVLYAGVIAAAVFALLANATWSLDAFIPVPVGFHRMYEIAGESRGLIEPARLLPLLILLPLLGLRDKTIFLAARAEVYGTLTVIFLLPGPDLIFTAKMFLLLLWWGAATSKLNRHFPFVVSVMMSNNPLLRARAIKRAFFTRYPDDMRPSRLSAALAHGGTAIEYLVPLLMVISRGGVLTIVAATIMVLFHLNILTSIPLGVPLEWNVFMIFSICFLMVHYAAVGPAAITQPIPVAVILAVVVATIVVGNLMPRKISFLPAMRYYAGNWDTSLWCLKPTAAAKLDAGLKKAAVLPATQLARLYGERTADILAHKGMAFRAMHTHGRALYGMIPRLCGPAHESDYLPIEGELIAGIVLGWNFGDGHLHNSQLIEAVQERCQFDPGEVRVIVLDAQPFRRPRQHYQLIDAATGVLEDGYVAVSDMVASQPWIADFPAQGVSAPGAVGPGAVGPGAVGLGAAEPARAEPGLAES